jgi:membrane protein DedA with SNARE-associated domain
MESGVKALGAGFAVASGIIGLIMFAVILGTLFGAISAWFIGLFFGDTILHVLGQFGVHDVTMWQLGAFFGFLSGYIKTTMQKPEPE